MIKFKAETEPVPFKRVMTHGKRRYNNKRYSLFKEVLGHLAKIAMQGRAPFKGAIKIKADFYKPKPKPTSRNWGDLDNHLKAVMDSLNGICYEDDSQVVEAHATKNFGEAHIEIELEATV